MGTAREVIVYKGIRFYRYPQSKSLSLRSYFRPNIRNIKQGYDSLHRELWRDWFGSIPKGFVVHHKDGNPLNNKLRNLELKDIVAHSKRHCEDAWKNRTTTDRRSYLKKAWRGNKKWHNTLAGKKHHKLIQALSVEAYKKRERRLSCVFCNELFITKSNATVIKYCSWSCNYRHLRVLRGLPVRANKWKTVKKRLGTR